MSYIEREKVLAEYDRQHKGPPGGARKIIETFPAADVRPVVFCKDCRYRDPEDHKCDSGKSERQGCPLKVADDYFCAYGEK